MGLLELQKIREERHIIKPKKIYTISKKSQKKLNQEKIQRTLKPIVINKATLNEDLEIWFNDRRKEMKGTCANCGGLSCKYDDKYFKFSIAHILPKAYFESIATNEYNWIELCFWKNNCHGNLDNSILQLSDLNCWDEVVTKFLIMYPSIAKSERRRIPDILRQYINIDL